MPRKCTVCEHPKRAEIDTALADSATRLRGIARTHHLSEDAVFRHKTAHLPATLSKAHEAEEASRADDLLRQVKALQGKTLSLLLKAEAAGELRTALAAIREARGNLELLAKLAGELDERPVVNVVLIDPRVRDAIVRALAPYGEARLAVANALEPFEEAS
jgi:hypothetical protein